MSKSTKPKKLTARHKLEHNTTQAHREALAGFQVVQAQVQVQAGVETAQAHAQDKQEHKLAQWSTQPHRSSSESRRGRQVSTANPKHTTHTTHPAKTNTPAGARGQTKSSGQGKHSELKKRSLSAQVGRSRGVQAKQSPTKQATAPRQVQDKARARHGSINQPVQSGWIINSPRRQLRRGR